MIQIPTPLYAEVEAFLTIAGTAALSILSTHLFSESREDDGEGYPKLTFRNCVVTLTTLLIQVLILVYVRWRRWQQYLHRHEERLSFVYPDINFNSPFVNSLKYVPQLENKSTELSTEAKSFGKMPMVPETKSMKPSKQNLSVMEPSKRLSKKSKELLMKPSEHNPFDAPKPLIEASTKPLAQPTTQPRKGQIVKPPAPLKRFEKTDLPGASKPSKTLSTKPTMQVPEKLATKSSKRGTQLKTKASASSPMEPNGHKNAMRSSRDQYRLGSGCKYCNRK